MPCERQPISRSQLGELLAIEPSRLIAIEKRSTGFCLVLEPDMNTSGSFPQLTQGGKRIGTKPKKGKK